MKKLLATLALLASTQLHALEVGDKAPEFSTKDDAGNTWKSADHVGKVNVIVYFYPAAMTGGCTKQACSYRDGKDELSKLGAVVVAVSGDHVDALKNFKIAENLNFPLLSDASGEISKAFGVPTRPGGELKRTVNGKEVTLIRDNTASRWTFVIGKNGKVIYKNTKVNPTKDLEEVSMAIKGSK
jgi:peroxiredoxin Q/BCP